VGDIRQREIHTAEPFLPEPNLFEDEIAFPNLHSYALYPVVYVTTM
jgi:hypothetical protein